jgi:hypothetical protein
MFVGQQIRLWEYRVETLQVLIEQQHMLTVTKVLGEGRYMGMLEDGSVYSYENGSWRAESAEGVRRFESAVLIWNLVMREPMSNMRVILLPHGENIVPDGNVVKCTKHNLFSLAGNVCPECRMEPRTSASL